MVFGGISSSPRGTLSPQQAIELANLYLMNARNATDSDIALVLCHDTAITLSHAKKVAKSGESPTVADKIATAYIDLGRMLESHGNINGAQAVYKKAGKLGMSLQGSKSSSNLLVQSLKTALPRRGSQSSYPSFSSSADYLNSHGDVSIVPGHIFEENVRPPAIEFTLPELDERINSTPQLASCLAILRASQSNDDILDPDSLEWLQLIENDTDEQARLQGLALEIIREFIEDVKDARSVAEVVCLAPVLDKDPFRELLREFYSDIDCSDTLEFHQLEGMARLIQDADPGHICADDLVKILEVMTNRLKDEQQQSIFHIQRLTLAVSHVLDAMADTKVPDLNRKNLHEHLSLYIEELKKSSDPYLVYQAAYAFQALLCIPDDKTAWQVAMRRTGKVLRGISGIASVVKGLDLTKFIEGLGDVQKGFTGYKDVISLAESGRNFMNYLEEGFSFARKRDWYAALRGADALIRDGELASFKHLVCAAPCRLDPAFQWGVCQRLGDIAANQMWDADVRRGAIDFLGEIYKNDAIWGQQSSIKQYILNILMQLTPMAGVASQLHASVADNVLRELGSSGNNKKWTLYRASRVEGPLPYPLNVTLPEPASPSLLDRIQDKSDIEMKLRDLRKQRIAEHANVLYIPPQAKASSKVADDTQFLLKEKIKKFLNGYQKVFLLLGECGAGKSTFLNELEFEMWQAYKVRAGRIPLHIDLPSIDEPEHDLIPKQLRKHGFTDPEIEEMRSYHSFVLICDGYDECRQEHNLYMTNKLNEPGEWSAQMVITCRSEYLGADYRDRFQPGGRNQQSLLFEEVVITPFSDEQIQALVEQYVSIYQPLWPVEDYMYALEHIPSLKELVKNPFMMALSLEVLPRMVNPEHNLLAIHVTRVTLYDHFIERWLERGKRRLERRELTEEEKTTFEGLDAEGFIQKGVEYLKMLAMAVYKEQDGHPVVEYSQSEDEGTWKDALFEPHDLQLLREASPVSWNGKQLQFIHRTLLEYALVRAVFDPQDAKNKTSPRTALSHEESAYSIPEIEVTLHERPTASWEPDSTSPLVWKVFNNDHALLRLLVERVQQEKIFKEQLLAYIEHSKNDEKWSSAAANAITILVRAGVQFTGADLRDIRIPGADLSYGIFDSAQFQGADLTGANLRGTWLRQAVFEGAHMADVQFGEVPVLNEDSVVMCCRYSPDGNSLAIGLSNGHVYEYSVSTLDRTLTLTDHKAATWHVDYSPTGNQIATCSSDMTVRLWDAATGACQDVLVGHTSLVTCVVYSSQEGQVASSSHDMTVRLWNTSTGDCTQVLTGHTKEVYRIAYAPDGSLIASGSWDHTIRLWNVETGACIHTMSGHSDMIYDIAFSPQGDQVASASDDMTVRLWDVGTGHILHILNGHSSGINSVSYSPAGDHIVSGGQDHTLRLWDVESGQCRQSWTGHSGPVLSVAFSPKGDQITSGSFDKTIRLWDISPKTARPIPSSHSTTVYGIHCSPNGDQIATGGMDKTIRLWDAQTGDCRMVMTGAKDTVYSIAYSPQGDQIATGTFDNMLQLWDVETGACHHVFSGHTDWVSCVAYYPQGKLIASASFDKTVRLWDLASGGSRILTGHTDGVIGVAFSADGKWLATGGKDSAVRVWEVETLDCRHTLECSDCIWSVAFSPQGHQLAAASADNTVHVWDMESGQKSFTLTGHKDCLSCVAYSPKGDLLASSSADKTVRLWDTSSGACRAVINNLEDAVRGISWRSDSETSYMVTGSEDGSVIMWKVTNEEDQCHVNLDWIARNPRLTLTGVSMEGVHELSRLNVELLKQRGVTGECPSIVEAEEPEALEEQEEPVQVMSEPIRPRTEPLEQHGLKPEVELMRQHIPSLSTTIELPKQDGISFRELAKWLAILAIAIVVAKVSNQQKGTSEIFVCE